MSRGPKRIQRTDTTAAAAAPAQWENHPSRAGPARSPIIMSMKSMQLATSSAVTPGLLSGNLESSLDIKITTFGSSHSDATT